MRELISSMSLESEHVNQQYELVNVQVNQQYELVSGAPGRTAMPKCIPCINKASLYMESEHVNQ